MDLEVFRHEFGLRLQEMLGDMQGKVNADVDTIARIATDVVEKFQEEHNE